MASTRRDGTSDLLISLRQRVLRSINWALGLCLLALVVMIGSFVVCLETSHAIVWTETSEVRLARPQDSAPQAEQDEWEARSVETQRTAYRAAGRAFLLAIVYVGVPTALLLIAVCILLYQVRKGLRREE